MMLMLSSVYKNDDVVTRKSVCVCHWLRGNNNTHKKIVNL